MTVLSAEKDNIHIESRIESDTFYSGVPFSYTVLVAGSDAVVPSHLPKTKDFAIKLIESKSLIKGKSKGFFIKYRKWSESDSDAGSLQFWLEDSKRKKENSKWEDNENERYRQQQLENEKDAVDL